MYIHAYIYVKGRKEKKKGKKGTELARGYINMPMPRKRWKDGVESWDECFPAEFSLFRQPRGDGLGRVGFRFATKIECGIFRFWLVLPSAD